MHEALRPPLPPFNEESAIQKVRMAEDGWNLKIPEKIALAYSPESQWRNRDLFLHGRDAIIDFLRTKYAKEHEYRLCKELWAYTDTKIAVRFAYEWHDDQGQWWRSYGNENWEFNDQGQMRVRFASINDVAITHKERKLLWDTPTRPDNYPSLSAMGL